MASLQKTEAIVLRKINYGDTSKIVTLYTLHFGKITAIVKGGRASKSKIGAVVDTLNHVEIVFYDKSTRDVQLISQADLINHFPRIREDLEKFKYAAAILELIQNLIHMNEPHERIFLGTGKIFTLMDSGEESAQLLFVRYFLFFIDELGYGLQLDKFTDTGVNLSECDSVIFNNDKGFINGELAKEYLVMFHFDKELFNLLACLSTRNKVLKFNEEQIDRLIYFLEKYLKYHINEFNGLKSLQVY
ncbi:MAG: DNA repair protein RecO [Melioribacteraceae bacterium]|nr:DNA repair protein RecO [Melioribacteraceae bacterium]MCF8265464.1 DNA repair protein RecO [Melioribacteraceae bacterium]MCF8432258.1 DNA repair protein RecO [Melioribacteraceae bacterium]